MGLYTKELSLFTGGGGGILATQYIIRPKIKTICYIEKNPYRIALLKKRISEGFIEEAPIWDDIKTFNGKPWRGHVDLITAGFPCTPFSKAGKMAGKNDPNNLWPETIRIIQEVKPICLFLENVRAILCSRNQKEAYFSQILRDLSNSGYNVKWKVLSASEIGAPHKRDRLWIMAYAEC